MKEPIRILVDWGSTLIRDDYLFNYIAEQSGNKKTKWESPQSWNKIRFIGDRNFFDENIDSFFNMGDEYPDSVEVISTFCRKNSTDSEVFLIYDNKPLLSTPPNEILSNMAESFKKKGGEIDGTYISADKLCIAKQAGISILVDDDPRIVLSFALSGIKAILMLRKWNRFFRLEDLQYTTKEENLEKIKSNITIAEDWFEAGIQISSIIDSLKS